LFAAFGLDVGDAYQILRQCDLPKSRVAAALSEGALDPKGFWRVDKDKDPELRHTVLTLVAFHDLEQKIEAAGGDQDKGIAAFLSQNHGEGWMLPETLRLADYDLGHDDRARDHQPVASRLGPRFYDWQLVQTPEECEQESHLHARNLLGAAGYGELLAKRIAADASDENDFAPLVAGLATHLHDHYQHRLLGEPGIAALIADLCAWKGRLRKSWRKLLTTLTAAGHLDDSRRDRVLDRLRQRQLITARQQERLTTSGPILQEGSADLLAAEPKHRLRLRSQRDPRKLFDD